MPRKKKVVEEANNVVEFPADDVKVEVSEEFMPTPTPEMPKQLTIEKFVEICTDGDKERIRKALAYNLKTTFMPFNMASQIAREIVERTCFDDDHKFVMNSTAVRLYCAVLNFTTFIDIDTLDWGFADVYDVLARFGIPKLLGEVCDGYLNSELDRMCTEVINDYYDNNRSIGAIAVAVKDFIEYIQNATDMSVTDALKDPDAVQNIIDVLKANAPAEKQ